MRDFREQFHGLYDGLAQFIDRINTQQDMNLFRHDDHTNGGQHPMNGTQREKIHQGTHSDHTKKYLQHSGDQQRP